MARGPKKASNGDTVQNGNEAGTKFILPAVRRAQAGTRDCNPARRSISTKGAHHRRRKARHARAGGAHLQCPLLQVQPWLAFAFIPDGWPPRSIF